MTIESKPEAKAKKVAKKCPHGKQKQYCGDCGGSQMCVHKRQKRQCRDCGGANYCSHGTRKSRCRECKGSEICCHSRFVSSCRTCGPQYFCKHNKEKSRCTDCKGTGVCEHNQRRSRCILCGGSQVCCHGKRKESCKLCEGSQTCDHKKLKVYCKPCDGSRLCKSSWCETTANPKYEGYCLNCFIHLFPDKPNARNYKTKEKAVADSVRETFNNFMWTTDKRVAGGNSYRRPDLFLDLQTHVVIVEVDEKKHSEYDCACENKRLMELSQDLNHRPAVFIRFNPDAYIDTNGQKVKSCWKLNKLGIVQLKSEKLKEWESRLVVLKNQIRHWIENPTEKTLEIIELFY